MGPYCKFCDRRCFVPRMRPDNGTLILLATCAAGRAHDRAVLPFDPDSAPNPAVDPWAVAAVTP